VEHYMQSEDFPSKKIIYGRISLQTSQRICSN
jgi:hypothetical protein